MQIKNIDFSSYDELNPATLKELAQTIYTELSDSGFITVSNIGITQEARDTAFLTSKSFFKEPLETKKKVQYKSAVDNFGYQGVEEEHLDPSKPADLKETFTMRNVSAYIDQPDRWPSEKFRDNSLSFYKSCIEVSHKLMRVFSTALDTEADFFIKKHEGENITLRYLHYPEITSAITQEDQLGAGAHTDYGMITLLFQDGVEGLEVKDKNGNWLAVPAHSDRIIINTGDLMHRWTNNIFRSTPHRVRPQVNGTERYSIAMFIDPDEAVQIETLESCITPENPNRYEPITAGEHILQKITATHGGY